MMLYSGLKKRGKGREAYAAAPLAGKGGGRGGRTRKRKTFMCTSCYQRNQTVTQGASENVKQNTICGCNASSTRLKSRSSDSDCVRTILTCGLFSKHFTVEACPEKRILPPRSLKIGCMMCILGWTTTSTASG